MMTHGYYRTYKDLPIFTAHKRVSRIEPRAYLNVHKLWAQISTIEENRSQM